MTNILYSFRRCPYAIRARMALKYSEVNVKIIEISLKDKPKEMLEISPKGQVPVLLLESKKVIDESRDIISFALSKNDSDEWSIKDKQKLIESEELLNINDGFFKESLDKYKYPGKYPKDDPQDGRILGQEFLKILEKKLTKHNYLFADKISYADVAIFPFIRQFAHVDKDWFYQTPYLKLQNWLDGFLDSKLFNDVMEKDCASQLNQTI
jgi:glutathione S-transferase